MCSLYFDERCLGTRSDELALVLGRLSEREEGDPRKEANRSADHMLDLKKLFDVGHKEAETLSEYL